MFKSKVLIAFIGIFFLMAACQVNPFTGKKNLALVPNSTLFPMAIQQYSAFLQENKVVTNTTEAKMVERIGNNIADAAQRYLSSLGYTDYLKDYHWEYKLVDDPQVNAWCMPGGKIVVYTGILPIAETEAGLAAIMGHEVSHALLNHSQQRMSQEQLTALAGVAGSLALDGTQAGEIFNQYYGVGAALGLTLPFSRKNENEADAIGLELMAIAGYDPQAAVELWQRMAARGGSTPEFLSTHPSGETRVKNLSAKVKDAKAVAAKFGVTSFKK